jgi:peptidoglycan-associated lipoprotein
MAAAAAAPMPMPTSVSGTEGSVHIDDRIVRACGDLPTAHFAFDSANVLPDSASALDALARCFVSGPLRGRGMKLIGHADPRGETEYNLALGHQRAYSVLDILAQRGIEIGRMTTSSKGEFDAVGSDEDGWARDRKVEVILAD